MSYHHLSRKERGMIALWENNRVPRREIARRLHRSPSTISRELANGKGEGRYRADEAQKRSVLRRRPATVRCAIRIRGSNNMCGKS